MVIGEDGSMGAWGGNKYEGLGVRNVKLLICRNFQISEESKVFPFITTHRRGKKFDLEYIGIVI